MNPSILRAAQAAVAAAAILACTGCGRGTPAPGDAVLAQAGTAPAETDFPSSPADSNAPEQLEAHLWFADDEGNLVAESRPVPRQPTAALQARALIDALAAGPATAAGLSRVLPPDTSVRALYLTPQGTAYVDLSRGFETGLSAGSEDALLAARSIVQTLADNIPEVRRVKILVEGEEAATLGGHLDLSRPLEPEGAPR